MPTGAPRPCTADHHRTLRSVPGVNTLWICLRGIGRGEEEGGKGKGVREGGKGRSEGKGEGGKGRRKGKGEREVVKDRGLGGQGESKN